MKNHLLRVLSIQPFLYLWLSEIFSQIAVNMMNFVLIIVAFKLTNSNTAVAGIVLSYTIPSILFGLLAGVYVDRWNKKRVLFVTNILRTALLLVLAFAHSNLLVVYFFSFVISIVTQFFIPAETPMIPLLVPKKMLISANALFGMGIYGSILIAYGLSGPFLILFGQTNLFIVLAIIFFVSAICITFIKKDHQAKDGDSINDKNYQKLSLREELKIAFSLMIKTKEIYQSLFYLTIIQLVILVLGVIGPGFSSQILKINVEQFPLYVVTPAALGMVFGAILIGNFLHKASKQKSIAIGLFLSSVGMLLLPYGSKVTSKDFIIALNSHLPSYLTVDILHIIMLLSFILGVANALVFVPSNTILQEKTSDEFRGKVYGALNAFVGIVSLLPVLIVGELADIFGVAKVLTWIGILIGLIAFQKILSISKVIKIFV